MNLNKLSFNDSGQSVESFGRKPLENQISIFGSKGSNHRGIVVRSTSYVKNRSIRWHVIHKFPQVADEGRLQLPETNVGSGSISGNYDLTSDLS